MTCEKYRELMSAAIDCELTEIEQAELTEHVKQCEDCRTAFEAIQRQHKLMREPAVPPHPRDLRGKVRARLALKESRGWGRHWHGAHGVVYVPTEQRKRESGHIMGPMGRA